MIRGLLLLPGGRRIRWTRARCGCVGLPPALGGLPVSGAAADRQGRLRRRCAIGLRPTLDPQQLHAPDPESLVAEPDGETGETRGRSVLWSVCRVAVARVGGPGGARDAGRLRDHASAAVQPGAARRGRPGRYPPLRPGHPGPAAAPRATAGAAAESGSSGHHARADALTARQALTA